MAVQVKKNDGWAASTQTIHMGRPDPLEAAAHLARTTSQSIPDGGYGTGVVQRDQPTVSGNNAMFSSITN